MNKSTSGWLAAILVSVLWGTPSVLGKFILELISFPTLIFFQYFTAIITLLFILALKKNKAQKKKFFTWKNKKDVMSMAVVGILGHGAFTSLSLYSLKFITAAENGIIQAIIPLLILLIASVFYDERFTKPQIITGFGAFFGIVLLVLDPTLEVHGFNEGHLLCFLCTLCFASCAHKRSQLSVVYGPVHTMLYQYIFAFIAASFLLFFSSTPLTEFLILSAHPKILLMLSFIGVIVTGISYLFYIFAMKQIGVEKTGIALNLLPISSFILGAIFLGEEVTLIRVFAIFLVVLSVLLFELLGKRVPISFGSLSFSRTSSPE